MSKKWLLMSTLGFMFDVVAAAGPMELPCKAGVCTEVEDEGTSALIQLRSLKGLMSCLDSPRGWVSSTGNSCAQYAQNQWCTPSGSYGSGWLRSYGTFANWAVNGIDASMACCACGGPRTCSDSPHGWVSSTGNSCAQYAHHQWCTPSGSYGSGWLSSYGTFANWAVNGIDASMACCVCGGPRPTREKGVDLLIIRSIQCIKPADGLDFAGTAAFAALGGIVAAGATITAGGATVVASGGTAAIGVVHVGPTAIASAAAGGSSMAVQAARMLDGHYSGTDNLIVQVDGKQVLPSSGQYRNINAHETIDTNIQVSFKNTVRISLIEYDWGSDNDDLGYIDIRGGMTHQIDRAIITAPRPDDGSIYYVSYSVAAGKGDPSSIVEWMLCGTNQCDACARARCEGQDYSQLDRDKDRGDLKACPSGFSHVFHKMYDQIWPVADVYLNVCKRH